MKTTEEMHNRYYGRFFEQTGLTFDQVPMHDMEITLDYFRKDLSINHSEMFKRIAIIRLYELFVEGEEKRVNKKWRKRNDFIIKNGN